ncbi:MAG: DNA-binding protein [Cyanobacteria bacterium J06642_2]
MPRRGISYSDVELAIQSLSKAGLTPSIRLIREQLGKGSLSTIAEHKRTFDAKQFAGPGPALPDPVSQHLMTGAKALWQELVDAAESQIQAIQTTSSEKTERVERELDEAQQALVSASDTIGKLRATLSDRDAQLEVAQQALSDREQDINERAVLMSRLEAERDALIDQRTTMQAELDAIRKALTSSQAETAQLTERIERQAVESAKDKVTLQKHFNEYKDRLVTMSDERRQALKGQKEAEKQAAAMEKQVSESEHSAERLNRELIDSRNEVRFLTEALGEARGELSTMEARFSAQITDRDTQLKTLQNELEIALSQVREYASTDRSLVQVLIDERRSASA